MSVQYGGNNITFADGSTLGSGWTGFKNRIINGAMVIDQRNAGASISTGTTDNVYTVDRWKAYYNQANKYTVQQNAGSVTPPVGFSNYLGVTSSSAYTPVSGDYFLLNQCIEGYNIADLAWGTANAKTVTLSFWVYSSLTGTFGGSILNANFNRTYAFTYTISSANTWTYVTVSITGCTDGTWGTGTSLGLNVRFVLGCHSSRLTSTVGSWVSSGYDGPTGSTSVVGTNGATFYITGVQLEKGSTATSFDYRPYGTELDLCKRYFQMIASGNDAPWGGALFVCQSSGSNTNPNADYQFIKTMRAMPSIVQTASQWRFNGSTGDLNLNGTWTLNTGISGPIVNGSDATTGRLQFSTNGTLGPVAEARIITNGGYAALSAEL